MSVNMALAQELDEVKASFAQVDDEARRLRFALYEIEDRATALNMHGIAQMAQSARRPKADGPDHARALIEAAKAALAQDAGWKETLREALEALGVKP